MVLQSLNLIRKNKLWLVLDAENRDKNKRQKWVKWQILC